MSAVAAEQQQRKSGDVDQPQQVLNSAEQDGQVQPTGSGIVTEDAEGADEKPPPVAPVHYEYMDHTADVQLHAWGTDLEEALEQLVISLYGYMTTDAAQVDPLYTMDFSATGHDLSALVYNLLDNCLYNFAAEPFFIGRIAKVVRLNRPAGNTAATRGSEELSVHIRVWGESFDTQKHPPGTEVKAITYSNMQILRSDDQKRTDIFVIVDI